MFSKILLRGTLPVIALLAPLPAFAAATTPYVQYQGHAGAYAGFYPTIYTRYPLDVVDPTFLNLITAGREVWDDQTVPATIDVPGSGAARSVHPAFSFLIPVTDSTILDEHADVQAAFSSSATPGAVHASASVVGKIDPVSYTYVDENNVTQVSPNFAIGHGVAGTVISFHDFITVGSSSPSLHVGDPVTVRLTGTFDSNVSVTPATTSFGYGTQALGIFALDDHYISMTDGNGFDAPRLLAADRTQFLDVTLHVGDTVELLSAINLFAEGVVSYDIAHNVANIADASNTALTHLDVLTPGATLSSATGFDYTAVPEPASMAILTALPLVGLTRRRARR